MFVREEGALPSEEDVRITELVRPWMINFDKDLFPCTPITVHEDYPFRKQADERISHFQFSCIHQPQRWWLRRFRQIPPQYCYEIRRCGVACAFEKERNFWQVSIPNPSSKHFSEQEFAIGLGAHEVRHRLQYERPEIELFTPWNIRHLPWLHCLAFTLLQCKCLFRGNALEFNLREFDALMVEHIVAWVVHLCGQPGQKLSKLVSSSPETLIQNLDQVGVVVKTSIVQG